LDNMPIASNPIQRNVINLDKGSERKRNDN